MLSNLEIDKYSRVHHFIMDYIRALPEDKVDTLNAFYRIKFFLDMEQIDKDIRRLEIENLKGEYLIEPLLKETRELKENLKKEENERYRRSIDGNV